MYEFIESDEWKQMIKWDYAFYKAVNASLDRTIYNELGKDNFDRHLKKYIWAQKIVKEKCVPLVKAPCANNGEKRLARDTNCLFHDGGCAYECLDEVAKNLSVWNYFG